MAEKQRAEEMARKKETDEKLATFRQQKDQVDKVVTASSPMETDSLGNDWSVTGKKRKQPEKGLVKGIKLRKMESKNVNEDSSSSGTKKEDDTVTAKSDAPAKESKASPEVKKATVVATLGLAGYSSDDDSENE
jgi:hypothetical protein